MALYNVINNRTIEKFLKKQENPLEARQALEAFYENTTPVHGVRVNERFFIIDRSVLGFCLLDPKEIAWVYPRVTNMKLYGVIPTGHINGVGIRTRDGVEYQATVATKGAMDELFRHLFDYLPGAVFGYNQKMVSVWNESIKDGHKIWDELARMQHASGAC